jgi:predicted PurR-regulated permease PerM
MAATGSAEGPETPHGSIAAGRSAPPRAALVLTGAAAAVVIAAGLRAANGLLAPMLLALVLTIAVAPLRGAAIRRGVPSWGATVIVLVATYGIVLFLTVSVAAAIVQLAATLPQYADDARELTDRVRDGLAGLGMAKAPTGAAVGQLDLGKLTGLLSGILSGLLEVLSSFFFLATLLFFLTSDAATAQRRTDLLRRSRPALMDALGGFVHATQRYLIVSAVFGGIVAVLDTGALWLLGVPLAALWGLLSFVTNFIPNVGFVIGLVPPALLALLDGGWQKMVSVILVYCVLNVVIQTLIQPRYVGDSVGLNTTVTFLSLAVWTFILGSLGALLAVPMTLLVRALLVDSDDSLRWVHLLIGSAPPSTDDVDHADVEPADVGEAGAPAAPVGTSVATDPASVTTDPASAHP